MRECKFDRRICVYIIMYVLYVFLYSVFTPLLIQLARQFFSLFILYIYIIYLSLSFSSSTFRFSPHAITGFALPFYPRLIPRLIVNFTLAIYMYICVHSSCMYMEMENEMRERTNEFP